MLTFVVLAVIVLAPAAAGASSVHLRVTAPVREQEPLARVLVRVRLTDAAGRGVPDVRCLFTWRQAGTVLHRTASRTARSGRASDRRVVSRAAPGEVVRVTVRCWVRGIVKQTATWFVPQPPLPDVPRIVFVGDSLTRGLFASTEAASFRALVTGTAEFRPGPEPLEDVETVAVSSLPDTFREVFRKRPFEAGPAPLGDAPAPADRPTTACHRGDSVMSLADLWFALFILIIAGYLILDGFDMGVGILHLPLARTDTERRTLLNSHRPGLGRQRGLARARRWRALRVLPARLRVAVLGLLPGHDARARGPHPAGGGHRVPQQGAGAALARAAGTSSSGRPRPGLAAPARRRLRQHRAAASRSTPMATSPSRSSTCSRPSRSSSGATTVAMFALHGALYLRMKLEGDLLARLEGLGAAPGHRLRGAEHARGGCPPRRGQPHHRSATRRTSGRSSSRPERLVALIVAWRLRARRAVTSRPSSASGAMIGLLSSRPPSACTPTCSSRRIDTAYNLTVVERRV